MNFATDTIYGDYRYDLAKLSHCYHRRYDEIVNDLFEIKESDDIVIEALLFISMIPLHNDYPDRQLAFFCQGIKLLDYQIEERGV